jgi:tetratricopeptide (TPR) repeat protein
MVLSLFACRVKKQGFVAHENTKKLNTKGISDVSPSESKAQTMFIKGEGYYLNQEYQKAIVLFDEVIGEKPAYGASYYKKAQCYDKLSQLSAAITNANTAVEKNPKSEAYSLFLIELYKKTDNYEQIIFTYLNLIENTKDAKHYMNLAEVYSILGKKEAQKRLNYLGKNDAESTKLATECEQKERNYYLLVAESLDKHEKEKGQRIEVLKSKQQTYLYLKEYEKAIAEGEKLVLLLPTDMSYRFTQADIIAKSKSLNDAILYMKNTVEKYPSSASARLVLAEFYKRNNQYIFFEKELDAAFSLPEVDLNQKIKLIDQMLSQSNNKDGLKTALDLSLRVVDAHPIAPQAHSILGDAYLMNKQPEEARNCFAKVVEMDKGHTKVWVELVNLDAQLKDYKSLLVHSKQAMEIFPEEYSFDLSYFEALKSTNKAEEGIQILEKTLQKVSGNPNAEFQVQMRLSEAYYEIKNHQKCFETFDKMLEFDPNNPLIINNFSYYLAESNTDLQKAESMMNRVVRSFPNELNYQDTYGWILYKIGRYSEALTYLENASKDGNSIALEHAGDAAFKNGELQKSMDYWTKAQKTGQASKEIQQKIDDKKIP